MLQVSHVTSGASGAVPQGGREGGRRVTSSVTRASSVRVCARVCVGPCVHVSVHCFGDVDVHCVHREGLDVVRAADVRSMGVRYTGCGAHGCYTLVLPGGPGLRTMLETRSTGFPFLTAEAEGEAAADPGPTPLLACDECSSITS